MFHFQITFKVFSLLSFFMAAKQDRGLKIFGGFRVDVRDSNIEKCRLLFSPKILGLYVQPRIIASVGGQKLKFFRCNRN